MVKFNNGAYEYSNDKMRPSAMEIEGAYRDALHKNASKFVVHIDGRRFGYDPGRRCVYELKDVSYQILATASPKETAEVITEKEASEPVLREIPDLQSEANYGIVSPTTPDTSEIVNVPTEDITGELTANDDATVENAAKNEDMASAKDEKATDIAAEINQEAEREFKGEGETADNCNESEDVERLESENAELAAKVQTLSSENVKYQRVIGIVLEMNSKIIAALK